MNPKYLALFAAFALVGAHSTVAAEPTTSISLTGGDTMKFNLTSFSVKPGELVHVELKNDGTLPKMVMGHNWILLKAGKDGAAYAASAISAQTENYEPKALADDVIASIGLLGARQTGEVTFTAPTAPGDYVYLCSFPAHYQAGMHGIMTVK